MSLTPVRQKSTPELSRTPFWKVAAPVVLVSLLIMAGVVAVVALLVADGDGPEQVSIASNVMLICFVLCPMLLCSTGFYVVLVLVSYSLKKLNRGTQQALIQAEGKTRKLVDKTQAAADSVSQKTIAVSARLAYLDDFWDDTEITQTEKGVDDD
jgi:hypothetical protein